MRAIERIYQAAADMAYKVDSLRKLSYRPTAAEIEQAQSNVRMLRNDLAQAEAALTELAAGEREFTETGGR